MLGQLGRSPGFQVSGETIVFVDSGAVRYVHPQPLVSQTFSVNIPIHVSQGECRVILGGATFAVKPDAITLRQDGHVVSEFRGIQARELSVFVFRHSATAVLYGSGRQRADANVVIRVPAVVSLECVDHSSGVFGPWSWLRGME